MKCKTLQSVIICSQHRSGSHLLCDLLAVGQAIPRADEWLIPTMEEVNRRSFQMARDATRIDYIRELVARKTNDLGVFSVKILGWNFVELIDSLSQTEEFRGCGHRSIIDSLFPNPTFVYLFRENRLAQAVSYARALQSDVWKSDAFDPERKENLCYSFLQINHLLSEIKGSEARWSGFFDDSGVNPLKFSYESLVESPAKAVFDVYERLGLSQSIDLERIETLMGRGPQADLINRDWRRRYDHDLESTMGETIPDYANNSFRLELNEDAVTLEVYETNSVGLVTLNACKLPWLGGAIDGKQDDGWLVAVGYVDAQSIHLVPGKPYVYTEIPFPLLPGERTGLDILLPQILEIGSFVVELAIYQIRDDSLFRLSNTVSLIVNIRPPAHRKELSVYFDDVEELSQAECVVPGFGSFFDRKFPWIHHEFHEWIKLERKYEEGGVLFYDNVMGWAIFYSKPDPVYFIQNTGKYFVFRGRVDDVRFFKNIESGEIVKYGLNIV